MNYGNGGIILQTHATGGGMPGPPFSPTSANNGLSIDPVSGKIVLGNNTAGILATLLSNREIPTAGFTVTLSGTITNDMLIVQGNTKSNQIKLNDSTFANASVTIGGKNWVSNQGISNDNIWIGYQAGSASSGAANSLNVGLGYGALTNNNSQGNIAIGYAAMQNFAPSSPVTNGCIAIGYTAMINAVGGLNNIGIGVNALASANNSSFSNTAVGKVCMYNLSSGIGNSGIGATINITTGQNNSFCGADIGANGSGIAGALNSAIGYLSLANLTTGGANTAAGHNAGQNWSTGSQNTAIGPYSFATNSTGNNNIGLGYFAGAYNGNVSNQFIVNAYNGGAPIPCLMAGDLANRRLAINVNESTASALTNTLFANGDIACPGTVGNTFTWNAASTAPALTATPVFTSFYGGNTNALGDPVGWILVNVAGVNRKVPFY